MPIILNINVELSGKRRSGLKKLKGRFQRHAELSGVLKRVLKTVNHPQHSGAEKFMQRSWKRSDEVTICSG